MQVSAKYPPGHLFWRDRLAKGLSKMSRRDLRVAIQLLTGHAALSYHLKKVKPTVSTTCPLCQAEDETVSQETIIYRLLV